MTALEATAEPALEPSTKLSSAPVDVTDVPPNLKCEPVKDMAVIPFWAS